MNLTLSSPKPPGTVLPILRANTAARRPSLWFPSNIREYFNGTITDDTFRIQRNIQYFNSFLPVIRGRVEPTESGSEIRLKMSIHPLVKAFMAVWFIPLVLVCVAMLCQTGNPKQVPLPTQIRLWGLLLFGILLAIVPFRIEAKKAQEKLESLFQ